MSILTKLRHWLQQQTTLGGLSLLVGGGVGLWTGSLPQDLGYTLMAASLPLLAPDNTTAQRIGQAALLPVVAALTRHGAPLVPPGEKPPDT